MVLVLRLSALGDVAMLIPVLYSIANRNKADSFVLLTKSSLVSIFDSKPKNVDVIAVYEKTKHKGLIGLARLIHSLSKQKIDKVADLHDVLRSQAISNFFRLKGKKIASINKGRREKKALSAKKNKIFAPLKSSIERYQEVFESLGYDARIEFKSIFDNRERKFEEIEVLTGKKNGRWIGIAPFAKHKGKTYPIEKMEALLNLLSKKEDIKIFLFGGGHEIEILDAWASKHENIRSMAGKTSFPTELLIMSYLDLMVSMDSGNMHLASLVATPVLSIWGATHPFAGFYGFGQDPKNAIQIEGLSCRPCSIFGNKACLRNDYACLEISPELIVEKIMCYEPGNKN